VRGGLRPRPGRGLWLLFWMLLSGCATARDARVQLVPVDAPPLRAAAAGLSFEVLRVIELRSEDPAFGGFSGLLVDGDALLMLSDRGTLWRTDRAAFSGTVPRSITFDKIRLEAPDVPPDAEDLAALDGGGVVVVTENGVGLHRLADARGHLVPFSPGPPRWLHVPGTNLGLETVATFADGRVLAISEGLAAGPGAVRAGLLAGGVWRPLRYPAADGWAPVGADRFGDDILVLERRAGLLTGFEARIRLISGPGDPPPDARLDPKPLVELRRPFPVDNFEGIAVATDGPGRATLYLISDDNFSALQRTLLVLAALRRTQAEACSAGC